MVHRVKIFPSVENLFTLLCSKKFTDMYLPQVYRVYKYTSIMPTGIHITHVGIENIPMSIEIIPTSILIVPA